MTKRNTPRPRSERGTCAHPDGCDQPRFARKLCQEHYLAGPVLTDATARMASEIRHHAKLMAEQLVYVDFVSQRSGQRIAFSVPSADEFGEFLVHVGWRLHPDKAVLKMTQDQDGQPTWMPLDAPAVAQRDIPVPSEDALSRLPVESLDAFMRSLERARAIAEERGVDLNGAPPDAG